MEWTEKFVSWFKQGQEQNEALLDIPWDVEQGEREGIDVIVATHPKVPFSVEVYVQPNFASIYVDPGIATDALNVADRMSLYKKLLHINANLNMMKTSLVGDDDRVVLAADLDLASLSKEEFNNALTYILIGVDRVIGALNIGDEVSQFMVERYMAMVYGKLKEGESKEDIINFLVNRVGLPAEEAEEFFGKMEELISEMDAGSTESGPPDNMYS